MSGIAENLARLHEAIDQACRQAGRAPGSVRLMAVSKTHPVELLLEAADAGHRLFGENRVQEFADKSQAIAKSRYTLGLGLGPDLRHQASSAPTGEATDRSEPAAVAALRPNLLHVHLIGHLQSNKSARAAEVFSGIDTVDSLKLAERLHDAAQRSKRILPILLEIKLSPEAAKEGIAPDAPELQFLLDRLPDLAAHLPLRGLMTVAPISADPAVATACFEQLRSLRDTLARQHPRLSFDELSMGMSGDFPAAIAAGSSEIRIGTAIFGTRPRPAG